MDFKGWFYIQESSEFNWDFMDREILTTVGELEPVDSFKLEKDGDWFYCHGKEMYGKECPHEAFNSAGSGIGLKVHNPSKGPLPMNKKVLRKLRIGEVEQEIKRENKRIEQKKLEGLKRQARKKERGEYGFGGDWWKSPGE